MGHVGFDVGEHGGSGAFLLAEAEHFAHLAPLELRETFCGEAFGGFAEACGGGGFGFLGDAAGPCLHEAGGHFVAAVVGEDEGFVDAADVAWVVGGAAFFAADGDVEFVASAEDAVHDVAAEVAFAVGFLEVGEDGVDVGDGGGDDFGAGGFGAGVGVHDDDGEPLDLHLEDGFAFVAGGFDLIAFPLGEFGSGAAGLVEFDDLGAVEPEVEGFIG